MLSSLQESVLSCVKRQRTQHFMIILLCLSVYAYLVLPSCYLCTLQHVLSTLVLVYLSWNISVFVQLLSFIPKQSIETAGRAVLITGCDTGFGHRLAHRLASHNFHVFAACLSVQSDGAQLLRSKYSEDRLTVVQLDVTKDESVRLARQNVQEKLKILKRKHIVTSEALWAVVNNAGIMQLLEIEFGDMRPFQAQFEVNTLGTVRVTKAFLSLLRAGKQTAGVAGRVVNVASMAGRFTFPGFVAYCMSKAAVISFSDGLRREMSKWAIEVVCIEPHLYKTNLVDKDRLQQVYDEGWRQTPKDVQEDYGREYYDRFVATMDTAMGTAREGIDQVVETMVTAVVQQEVEAYYRVMRHWERARVWAFETLVPVAVIDCILDKVVSTKVGLPARLAVPKHR